MNFFLFFKIFTTTLVDRKLYLNIENFKKTNTEKYYNDQNFYLNDTVKLYEQDFDLSKKNSTKIHKRSVAIDNSLDKDETSLSIKMLDNDPLGDLTIRNQIKSLGEPHTECFSYARRFEYLLETITPNLSNLNRQRIMNPTYEQNIEIKRVYKILKLKEEIASIIISQEFKKRILDELLKNINNEPEDVLIRKEYTNLMANIQNELNFLQTKLAELQNIYKIQIENKNP